MKYNKLIKVCEENNLNELDVINCLKKFIKQGSRPKWVLDRLNLYAKERIKQAKLNFVCSKIYTIRRLVASNEYKELYKKYLIKNKLSCVHTFYKLITEKLSRERLLQAFKNNGEREII